MLFKPGQLCVMTRDENGLTEGTKVYVRQILSHGNSEYQRIVATMDNRRSAEVWISSLAARRGRPRNV